MSSRVRRASSLAIAIVLIAAACGNDDDGVAASAVTPTATATAAATAEPGGAVEEDSVASEVVDATADWAVQPVGVGTKPALATAADGTAAVAYLTEAQDGGVFYATEAADWAAETVADGYFYGPIDLAFAPDGIPNIVYHDHQASGFQPELGDLTLATRGDDGWVLNASNDPGHDGWDSTIRFGPGGELWAAGIEPSDFGTAEGVEFYEFDGSTWSAGSVGGPAITYEFNVSLATGSDGEPLLSYWDDTTDELHVATRNGDAWVDEILPTEAGGGQFSSLVVDAAGVRHISFYAPTGPTGGDVFYAVDDGSGWQFETVQTLDDVVLGMTGARRITSLQILDDGSPVVATTDRSGVWVSTRGSDGWATELVFAAGDRPMGQQVQLVVADDSWRVVTFEVTNPSPLEGEIIYLSRGA